MLGVRVLGMVALDIEGRVVELSAPRERAILSVLALRAGRVVPLQDLIEALWPDGPPDNARKAVQTYVARIRRHMPKGVIVSVGNGYLLDSDACDVDVSRFERLVTQGRAAVETTPDEARRHLQAALALWSGDVLADLVDAPAAVGPRARLHEARLAAEEDLLEARLALGDHQAAAGDAEQAVAAEPLRERRWSQLMRALYASGRQADALRAYQRCRDVLVDELGVEPSAELRALETRMLEQDPDLLPARRSDGPQLPSGLPAPAAEAARGPLVGRTTELVELEEAWGQAVACRRPVVVLRGEPGSGKTRLAAAVGEHAIGEGGAVLWGRCHPELVVPFQPFAEALGPLAKGNAGSVWFEQLVGADAQSRHIEQYRLFQAVVDILARAASVRPLVLVLEDLHWATPPTLRLLRFLSAAPQLERVLVIGTTRSTERTDAFMLAERPGVSVLPLAPLRVEAVREWVATRLGPDERLAAELHEQAGGNPFLIEQLLRDRESGVEGVARHGRGVVTGRLARLRPSTRSVLELAATAGITFDLSVLIGAASDGEESVLDALEEAEEAGLVIGAADDIGRFSFCHALVRTALTEGLPRARALRLHRDLALAVEAQPLDEAALSALARHCAMAAPLGLAERAVEYAERAGQMARDGLAFEDAATYFGLALDALASLPVKDSAMRCDLLRRRGEALRQAGDPGALDVLGDAAALARQLGDPGRMAAVALAHGRFGLSGIDLAGAGSDVLQLAAEAVAALGDDAPELRARLLASMAMAHIYTGEDDQRSELVGEALRLARVAADAEVLLQVLISCLYAWADPYDLEGRLRLAREAVGLADEVGDLELEYRARYLLSLAMLEAADLDGSNEQMAVMQDVGARLKHPTVQAELILRAASDAYVAGDFEETERQVCEAHALALRSGWPAPLLQALQVAVLAKVCTDTGQFERLLEMVEPMRGINTRSPWPFVPLVVHADTGDHAVARAELDVLAAGEFADVPRRLAWNLMMLLASLAVSELEDAVRARTLLELLRPLAGRILTLDPAEYDLADRVIGRLCVVAGELDEAERHLAAALDLSHRRGSPVYEARTRVDLAHLAAARGDSEGVRRHAGAAATIADRLHAPGIRAAAERARGRPVTAP